MKIAILGTRGIPNNYGGFEQCAEFLSAGLVKNGHEVTVYNPNFHSYTESSYEDVTIVQKKTGKRLFGDAFSNFFFDYLCFKDATNKNFDIILELGLITASLSIILCRHKGKTIVTNLDGLEWKRAKWSKFVQIITKQLEKFGVKFSDYLISDNKGIQEYISKEYKRKSKLIAYGTSKIESPKSEYLSNFDISQNNYLLSIARLEPENNLEIMIDGYLKSGIKLPYVIIGNHLTNYGDHLKDKYRGENIKFLGGIFDKLVIDNLRYFSRYYLHGHSVGGTNPSLLEAMAASTLIIAHDNPFNKNVTKNAAYYFKDSNDISNLLKTDTLIDSKAEYVKINLKKIETLYTWSNVIEEYENYFKQILSNK